MCRVPARRARLKIADAGSEARFEAVIAQDPQHIFGDARCRVTDEADAASPQIAQAADRIVYRSVRRQKYRIDREVAARRVGGPIRVEGDPGAAPIGLD